MRSFGAAALYVLAIVTECLAAHSDRPRQRSGPIRSVPIAANVKRDVDFDCPEEFGYYPHPTDCTLYYVCVFGGALLESCTGGLMYSHELQTCDWPRNVGCDGTSAAGVEELERLSERDRDPLPPPPPPPRRTPPPPPPRAQPNPVVTSRGQPKFNRDEYEKQQQLYAEVDDLPPVEEIESDRQQRVYRGQPSTIGQVQKDRDGYGQQIVSSRTLNSNIIPASVPQNSGKIGSFSFGTQVDERRAATATPAPQTYSEDRINILTDSSAHDRLLDIETNNIDPSDNTKSRKKREAVVSVGLTNSTGVKSNSSRISDRSDFDEDEEYYVQDAEEFIDMETAADGEANSDDSERGKRQIRYYLQNGFKHPVKQWSNSKPIRLVGSPRYYHNRNTQNTKYQPNFNGLSHNNYYEGSQKPFTSEYSTANPFASYPAQDDKQFFKPSLRDPFSERFPHAGMNIATQIITKSPPISSLKNIDSLTSNNGGFYTNDAAPNSDSSQQIYNDNNFLQHVPSIKTINFRGNQDSSLLPSTVVTGKPVKIGSSPRPPTQKEIGSDETEQDDSEEINYNNHSNQKQIDNGPLHSNQNNEETDEKEENDDSADEESDQKDDDPFYRHEFPEPPYEFTHPKHKYEEIENPFADPNFDFDSYLANLRDSYETVSISSKRQPQSQTHIKNQQNGKLKADKNPMQEPTTEHQRSSLNYDGMSTPRPFSIPSGPEGVTEPNTERFSSPHSDRSSQKFDIIIQPSQKPRQNLAHYQQQEQQQMFSENIFRHPQNAGTQVDAIKPKLKPPNFNDDRLLPIFYNFNRPLGNTPKPHYDKTKSETQQVFTVTQKPIIFFTSTGSPILLSSPKQQYYVKPDKIITLQPHSFPTGKPYAISSMNPQKAYITFKQSTPKPLTTLVNEQLSALHKYWNNPTTATPFYLKSTTRPNTVSDIPKLESLFAQIIKSTPQTPTKVPNTTPAYQISSTTKSSSKRRPIPKPSPEMPDYYYDDDEEQYYYEPAVKPKYMPSSEVKPKRPPMAQNDQEYEDSDDSEEIPTNPKSTNTQHKIPFNAYKPEAATKNQNDVSAVTKAPEKHSAKLKNVKVPIPVFVDYGTPAPNVIMRPEVSNYEVFHHLRNRTILMRRPIKFIMTGPHTAKPPKYLNQTTLRPYTVRHRLAKPTAVKDVSTSGDSNAKLMRGKMRHHNIVAQMKLTTPRDSHKQETRFTKTKHDDKTNSLEPTESVTPTSYSVNPRPKMLYNGSQTYSPDQYDPYYAVYDEDGELYKDTDYVQQYNTASLRPAVQQTYRGTPPPARRPVETYTPRPTQVDYDDALIHGQIQNQNQYQSAIRQSTRGEGNELGYDHIPSSVKTTLYEATTSLSTTTPSTTSTSTTQRSTTAPFTEAMTPSRYTPSPRSSTDENPNLAPKSPSENPMDGSDSPTSSTSSPINFSALAKPFERTDNTHRLKETLTSTEKLVTKLPTRLSNNIPVDVVQPNKDGKNVVSLTSGFSFRRNPNEINSPYTLTVLTRPLESYNRSHKNNKNWNVNDAREESVESQEDTEIKDKNISSRRNDANQEIESSEHNTPIYVRPMRAKVVIKPRIKLDPTQATVPSTKYILKTVIKRPAPFSTDDEQKEDSTENIINTDALIETALLNARNNGYLLSSNQSEQRESAKPDQYRAPGRQWNEKIASPYKSLDSSINNYHKEDKLIKDYITSTASSNRFAPPPAREYVEIPAKEVKPSKSYYSYSVVDQPVSDRNTKGFSSTVKNIINAFLGNFAPSPSPKTVEQFSTTPKIENYEPEEKVVNIGFQKKMLKFTDKKPLQSNIKHLQILTEPSYNRFDSPGGSFSITEANNEIDQSKDFSSTSSTTTTARPFSYNAPEATRVSSKPTDTYRYVPVRDSFQSKFSSVVTSSPVNTEKLYEKNENSQKFQKIVSETPSTENSYNDYSHHNHDNEVIKLTRTHVETTTAPTKYDWVNTNKIPNDIASTTSTTTLTTTTRLDPTSTTKSLTFPTRATRVNPAIKLAATNPGGGRRSYQSSSKCATDDSLQANPKCNEIKYQRPSSPTRGRGSAHYTVSQGETPQQQSVNRGTPPTRSRPTLKPSTAVVTNPHPIIDIYSNPPRRPAPVYPQPTPDKTAAKCRKDVCLLPDCYCGGKDIPGDLPVESLPQLVLLTFDDSVNDLNKGLYADLFEKGRVNPNGCPISATFYVSHEWTDYSQVQNLYSAGHEMASHTISHSFGEQFSQKKWNREVAGQREILAAYGGVKLEDVRGMRAPFLSVGGNKMFKMLYDSNFTYDSSLPVYENRPPSWPYTLDYKLFHDCMIPPCPTKSYPGVWEVPMVMWQDLNGGRCSMGDACANPPEAEGVYKMLLKNFDRHYTTNRAPFGLFYHAAWFTQPHHKAGFIMFLDFINQMPDVWIVTNWQALQWVRDPTPISRLNNFQPFQCNYQDRPKKCNNPKVCNLWHKSGVRYMRTCQPCPEIYPWTGKTGIKSSRIDNDIEE